MSIDESMALARAAEDAGKVDEAYAHYVSVLEQDRGQTRAWLGKARAIALRRPMPEYPIDDVSAALTGALQAAPAAEGQQVRAEAATLLFETALAYHARIAQHFEDYVSARGSWGEYLSRCAVVLRALELAHSLDPSQAAILEKIVELCVRQIEGVVYTDVGDYQIVTERRHGITAAYAATLREKIADCAAELRASRPEYRPPEIHKQELADEGACFIATAAAGRPDHPDVVALRRFREETLVPTALGRALIAVYGRLGPGAARAIRRAPALRWISWALLVHPAAALLSRTRRRR